MADKHKKSRVFKLWVPQWAKAHDFEYDPQHPPLDILGQIKEGLLQFRVDNPLVSIVIPVYNEERQLLNVLSSFSKMKHQTPTELIVVNNNSKDATRELLEKTGVYFVDETKQGITNARHAGLMAAKGKIILSADSDTIYPPYWVDAYVAAFQKPNVVCAYATYSFLPLERNQGKILIGLFEIFMQFKYYTRKWKGREYLNVYGFNSAFLKEKALEIGGYNLKNQVWEDGRMALDLMKVGVLKKIQDPNAVVLTSSRRFIRDGGLIKGIVYRFKREFKELLRVKKISVEPRS